MAATNAHRSVYLNDHLAGSTAALELMVHLSTVYADTPVGRFAKELHADVLVDRLELERLSEQLGVKPSEFRKASAWVVEKFTRLKLRIDDPSSGNLQLLESLEALSLGIEGKRLLWMAFAAAAETTPSLRIADFIALRTRAEEQRGRVELHRRAAAAAVLAG